MEEKEAQKEMEELGKIKSEISSLINKYNALAERNEKYSRLGLAVKELDLTYELECKFYKKYDRNPKSKQELEEFKKTINVDELIEDALYDDCGFFVEDYPSGWFPSEVCTL